MSRPTDVWYNMTGLLLGSQTLNIVLFTYIRGAFSATHSIFFLQKQALLFIRSGQLGIEPLHVLTWLFQGFHSMWYSCHDGLNTVNSVLTLQQHRFQHFCIWVDCCLGVYKWICLCECACVYPLCSLEFWIPSALRLGQNGLRVWFDASQAG